MAVTQKTKNKITIRSSSPTPGFVDHTSNHSVFKFLLMNKYTWVDILKELYFFSS